MSNNLNFVLCCTQKKKHICVEKQVFHTNRKIDKQPDRHIDASKHVPLEEDNK